MNLFREYITVDSNVKYISGVSYNKNGSYYDMIEDNINAEAVREGYENQIILLLCLRREYLYTEKPGDLNDLNIT